MRVPHASLTLPAASHVTLLASPRLAHRISWKNPVSTWALGTGGIFHFEGLRGPYLLNILALGAWEGRIERTAGVGGVKYGEETPRARF